MDSFGEFLAILVFVIFISWFITYNHADMPIEKAVLAQELCIKANSKAVSFDRMEVTCENKAIIPLKGE